MSYSIAQLVTDLKRVSRQTSDEREVPKAARLLARRAADAKADWLEQRRYETNAEQGFGVHLPMQR